MDGNVVEETATDAEVEHNTPGFGTITDNILLKSGVLLCGALMYAFTLYTVLITMIYPASVKPFFETDGTRQDGCWKHLVVDAALLLFFFLQHTGMANTSVKALLSKITSPALQRLLYSFASCLGVQVLYTFWRPTPSFTMWQTASGSDLLHVVLAAIQVLCWVFIACSLFFTDYLELIGLKQMYYSLQDMGDPMQRKAEEQRTLLDHMRHPLFFGPALILWAVPVMTYDRLLVAVMAPLYLGWGCHLDQSDVEYVQEQFTKKRCEIFDIIKKKE
ncbi:hypothetical protein EMCRGX_G008654 [Ephydatia muelleri]